MPKNKPQDIIKTDRLQLTPLDTKNLTRYVQIAKNMRAEKEKNPDYFLYSRFDYSMAKTDDDLVDTAMKLLTSPANSIYPEVAKRLNICLKNGYIIGYIGFIYNPDNEMNSDLGIFLDPKYEHKGYAFEAQKSLLAYYFFNYGQQIYLTIYPKNLPSYHLNVKCGAKKIAHTDQSKYGQERDILVITRKTFIATAFHRKLATPAAEKRFLANYLKLHNKI